MKKKNVIIITLICTCLLAVGIFTVFKNQKPKFTGFIEASIYILSYEQILDETLLLAEVEIGRKLSLNEVKNIPGVRQESINSSTYFKATINSDHLANKVTNEKIILKQFGTYEWQLHGDPTYKKGDKLLIFLTKNRKNDGYYCPMGGINGVLDIKEIEGEKYIFKRVGNFPQFAYISLPLAEDEKVEYKNGKDNPVQFTQKFKLDEFVSKVRGDYNIRVQKK